jgi:hypothetical protein
MLPLEGSFQVLTWTKVVPQLIALTAIALLTEMDVAGNLKDEDY